MNGLVEKLHATLYYNLILTSPVMSGNMQYSINPGQIGVNYGEIVIEAPFYDLKKWKKDKTIVHNGESKNGITDYANWVNNFGGFFTHNDSEHWVNRVCFDVASAIANEIGGIVINELEL